MMAQPTTDGDWEPVDVAADDPRRTHGPRCAACGKRAQIYRGALRNPMFRYGDPWVLTGWARFIFPWRDSGGAEAATLEETQYCPACGEKAAKSLKWLMRPLTDEVD